MRSVVLVLLGLFIFNINVSAQEVVASSGGRMLDNQYQVDWTLGELVTVTMVSNTVSVTQGFQQPQSMTSPPETIPSMGNWALFILGILMTNLALVFIYKEKENYKSQTVID